MKTMVTSTAMAACIAATLFVAAAADTSSRNWTVPGTHKISLDSVQYSDDPIVPSRQVTLRAKYGDFDTWGPITMYPVVRSPQGKLYYGFVRHYKAGTVNERIISYTFPEDFRADPSTQVDEEDADYGSGLLDSLEGSTGLPKGVYQAKWVVNNKLVDTYDEFTYPGFKAPNY